MINKTSCSGLFEVWAGIIIESDGWSPSRIHMYEVCCFDTSEAVEQAALHGLFESADFYEVRFPKDYLARMAKLERIKQARRDAEDPAPF
jgi:hypothetical protein